MRKKNNRPVGRLSEKSTLKARRSSLLSRSSPTLPLTGADGINKYIIGERKCQT